MNNFKDILENHENTNRVTEKQQYIIRHHKEFLNTELDENKLETISKDEASNMIREIIVNKERLYSELVEF